MDSWRHTWNETGFGRSLDKGADDGFGTLIPLQHGENGPAYAAWLFLYEGTFGFDCGNHHPTSQVI